MDKQQVNPSYFSILTADVRYNTKLSASEKVFYSEISALTNMKGYCTATNEYFCILFNVNKRTIQRWLDNLKSLKLIKIVNDSGTRKIYLIINSRTTKNTCNLTKEQQALLKNFYDKIIV